jgi:hypothetical protein
VENVRRALAILLRSRLEHPGERNDVRTRTYNAIVGLLEDRQWHAASEVAEKTRYADEWINELQRESVVEKDVRNGETVVRLRSDEPLFEMTIALN